MLQQRDKDLTTRFLKELSKIKGWTYHEKIEREKQKEIREFVSMYVIKIIHEEDIEPRIFYNRLYFLVEHRNFKPLIKAILVLLEFSDSEEKFKEHYQKVHASSRPVKQQETSFKL